MFSCTFEVVLKIEFSAVTVPCRPEQTASAACLACSPRARHLALPLPRAPLPNAIQRWSRAPHSPALSLTRSPSPLSLRRGHQPWTRAELAAAAALPPLLPSITTPSSTLARRSLHLPPHHAGRCPIIESS
jgi:hypothetical protein